MTLKGFCHFKFGANGMTLKGSNMLSQFYICTALYTMLLGVLPLCFGFIIGEFTFLFIGSLTSSSFGSEVGKLLFIIQLEKKKKKKLHHIFFFFLKKKKTF
jgi:hypothetical protein